MLEYAHQEKLGHARAHRPQEERAKLVTQAKPLLYDPGVLHRAIHVIED